MRATMITPRLGHFRDLVNVVTPWRWELLYNYPRLLIQLTFPIKLRIHSLLPQFRVKTPSSKNVGAPCARLIGWNRTKPIE